MVCFSIVRAALLSGLVLFVDAAPSARDSCDGSASCTEDDTSLLQQRSKLGAKRLQSSPAPAPTGKKAVAFAGGGFLSFADFTGTIMGLLNVMNRTSGGGLQELFQKFDIIAGTSGGTWFFNSLVYSASFKRLIEDGGSFPDHAGTLYNGVFQVKWFSDWMPQDTGHVLINCLKLKHVNFKRFQDASLAQESRGNSDAWKAALKKLDTALSALPAELKEQQGNGWMNVEKLRNLPFPDLLSKVEIGGSLLPHDLAVEYSDLLFEFLINTGGLHWEDAVRHLLRSGAGIDFYLRLGTTQVNEWARGKISLATSTAVTPPGGNAFWGMKGKVPQEVLVYNTSDNELSYVAKDANQPGNFVQPVRFSVVIGGGVEQNAPLPFCSSSMCKTYEAQYIHNGKNLSSSLPFGETFKQAFEINGGRIPISSAAAASSAAAGYTMLQHPIADQNCAELEVWASNVGGGGSFDVARNIRNQIFQAPTLYDTYAEQVAQRGLFPLIDGGFSDAGGIANAVAAGASEVLSWQDNYLVNHRLVMAELFSGSPHTGTVIFQTPTYQEVIDLYNNFAAIQVPEEMYYLKRIVYGSIQATTTHNDFFGIEAGRSVTLNVLAPEVMNITMGTPTAGFASFFNYGTLVQEIVETLSKSAETETILERFF